MPYHESAGTCMNAEKYNMVLTAYGTSVAHHWLPQALVLPTFIATFLSNRNAAWCVA